MNELRLSRQAVTDICRLVSNDIAANANNPYTLPVATKVMTALYFYAGGTFQHQLSSLGGMSQTSVSVAVKQVTNSLVQHAHEFIKFPMTPVSQNRVKQGFMDRYGFPGVLGAIDCTHVQIRAPAVHGVIYVNRKGNHSINIQVVCDAFQNIINVCANFPGSSHDAFIMDNSAIPAIFGRDPPPDGWLIGDNGYPSKTWLLVPYVRPTTVRQISFNRKHAQARAVIERTFGTLKQRYRCIDRSGGTVQYTPQKVASFFVACCVLHNIAKRHGVVFDDDLDEDLFQDFQRQQADLHVPLPNDDPVPANARAVRDQLADDLARRRRRRR